MSGLYIFALFVSWGLAFALGTARGFKREREQLSAELRSEGFRGYLPFERRYADWAARQTFDPRGDEFRATDLRYIRNDLGELWNDLDLAAASDRIKGLDIVDVDDTLGEVGRALAELERLQAGKASASD